MNSWARKPAVEPQMGIENEFPTQSPAVAKGYDFKNVNRTPSAQSAPVTATNSSATTVLALFLLGAPLILWGAISWKQKEGPKPDNVVEFNKDDHDDHDWPQAC
jgi:hypothetical protein